MDISNNSSIKHFVEILKNRFYFATTLQPEVVLKNYGDFVYFCVDNELVYRNYYQDFGPVNISCVYKYCRRVEDHKKAFPRKCIVHYTRPDPDKRANAAFMVGCYAILYLEMSPKDIYNILMSNDSPPYKPFVDASQHHGTSNMGFTLRLIECLQAVHKAHIFGFFDFVDFDAAAYDTYSSLQYGDLNWLLPRKFLAFIGPDDTARGSAPSPDSYSPHPASFYISYFLRNDVRSVIRLNNRAYNPVVFTNAGIAHYDLYFHDGTTPPSHVLRQFLDIAENARGALAVHCKAGLGRTGSLIGAYLVKHYRLSAREAIAWMRVCRPGSVIGAQQGWLERLEPWLWKQGDDFRQEHYENADHIPHHKYGIYSIRWREHRNKLMHQAAANAALNYSPPLSRSMSPTRYSSPTTAKPKEYHQKNTVQPTAAEFVPSSQYKEFLQHGKNKFINNLSFNEPTDARMSRHQHHQKQRHIQNEIKNSERENLERRINSAKDYETQMKALRNFASPRPPARFRNSVENDPCYTNWNQMLMQEEAKKQKETNTNNYTKEEATHRRHHYKQYADDKYISDNTYGPTQGDHLNHIKSKRGKEVEETRNHQTMPKSNMYRY